MNTLPDKGVIIGRIPTDQKVVGSTPAECAIGYLFSPRAAILKVAGGSLTSKSLSI